MAAADMHNTDILVDQYVQVEFGTTLFKKRGRVTAVGTDEVDVLGVGDDIPSFQLRVLPHAELEPKKSYDWASRQT